MGFKKTALNFHWKIMMAPISIIDYVIAHELAHYIKEDHSSEFWEIVESVMPNYAEKKKLATNEWRIFRYLNVMRCARADGNET